MTGPEHYRQAEQYAAAADRLQDTEALVFVGLAQVHATLAHVAALTTAFPVVEGELRGMTEEDAQAWCDTVYGAAS